MRRGFSSFLAGAIVVGWLTGSLYVGVGGMVRADYDSQLEELDRRAASEPSNQVTVGGVSYANAAAAQKAVLEEPIENYFPWLLELPYMASFLLTACGFGALGGVIRVLKHLVDPANGISFRSVLVEPLFGAMMGIMMLGLSYAIPAALTRGDAVLSPVALLFVCLFAGAFSDRFYAWIANVIDTKVLPK